MALCDPWRDRAQPWCVPISWLYRLAAVCGHWPKRLRHSLDPGVPVVSVGNITVGGSGKTPLVAALCRAFQDMGVKRVAVLSRGYGRTAPHNQVVLPGDAVTVAQVGDEPFLLRKQAPDILLVLAAGRRQGIRLAAANGADVIVMDDGFRHWDIRKLDLVCFDGGRGLGNGRMLPAGPLRMPVSALQRAHAIIITKQRNGALSALAARQGKPVFFLPLHVSGLFAGRQEVFPLSRRVALISAIALNRHFAETAKQAGLQPEFHLAFRDHIRYTPGMAENIARRARKHAVSAFVTTEKDYYKLTPYSRLLEKPLYYLKVGFSLADTPLLSFVRDALGVSKTA